MSNKSCKIVSSDKNFSWLYKEELQALLTILSPIEHDTLVVGGAVRNSLLGLEVSDIDLSTKLQPEQVMEYVAAAGYKVVATGLQHGTVTIIGKAQNYEVTTLREDLNTDGRHAVVKFTDDWKVDASRRDFTINALYLNKDGALFDYFDGVEDLKAGLVRFIGDPETRIQEDYLRILRFFRFYASYGTGAPDASALKACSKHKRGLLTLSSNRIWEELKKIFAVISLERTVLWLRNSSILTTILPASERWGLDHFHALTKLDNKYNKTSNNLLRIASLLPPREEIIQELSKLLPLTRAEKDYFMAWQFYMVQPLQSLVEDKYCILYQAQKKLKALLDSLYLRLAITNSYEDFSTSQQQLEAKRQEAAILVKLLEFFSEECDAKFPIKGQDLLDAGLTAGSHLGVALKELEQLWCKSAYALSKEELLQYLSKIKPSDK